MKLSDREQVMILRVGTMAITAIQENPRRDPMDILKALLDAFRKVEEPTESEFMSPVFMDLVREEAENETH